MNEKDRILEVAFESQDENNHNKIDIHNLKIVEQNILSYMLLSKEHFREIKLLLVEKDFTFVIHKIIYKYMLVSEELFVEESYNGITDFNTKLEIFANALKINMNVNEDSILDILTQTPSLCIEKDLEVINANSLEKEIAILSGGIQRSIDIETIDGKVWLEFTNDRLISVRTTNIDNLPVEIRDNFGDTLETFSKIDFSSKENESTMEFYGELPDHEGIASVHLRKDISQLQLLENMYLWADKYALSQEEFPRDRKKLKDLVFLELEHRGIQELPLGIEYLSNLKVLTLDNNEIIELPEQIGNLSNLGILSLSNNKIKELPRSIGKLSELLVLSVDKNRLQELPQGVYKLTKLLSLSFVKNEIFFISEEISKLTKLKNFTACHNNIKDLPKTFYMLLKLTNLCLHGNKITQLSDEIGTLLSLNTLSISNNEISILPKSIANLESLTSLDIENTNITEIPMDLLIKCKLKQLCVNDNLFPFVAQHINYLSVDTINLAESSFNESSPLLAPLSLKIENQEWIEEIDRKSHGCVKLIMNQKEIEE